MNLIYRLHARLLKKHSFAVICAFGVLLPMILYGAFQAVLGHSNDVTDWLPDKYPETRALRWYQQNFKAGSDHIVIVSWEDCTLDNERVGFYADKLRNSQFVASVITGPQLVDQIAETLDAADFSGDPQAEAIRRLSGSLIGPNFVHGLQLAADEQGRPQVVSVADSSPAAGLGMQPGLVITQINETATATLAEALEALQATFDVDDPSAKRWLSLRTESRDEPYRWEWSGERPGRQTAILVTLSPDGRNEKVLEEAINEIRRIGEEECAINGPDQRIRLGGPAVDNVSIDQEGKRTLGIVATLSFVVGLGMCWLCFRDVRTTLLVFFVALFSEATSLAIVFFSGAPVNAILLSMPTLIYVLTISGAIHIVNYYRDSIVETGVADAAHRAICKGLVPCTLSAVTTAIGLASLYIADLRPIRLFGLFSAIAIVSTLAWLFLFLPSVLHRSPPGDRMVRRMRIRARRPHEIDRLWARVGNLVVAKPTFMFVTCLAILLGVGVGVYKLRSSINLMKLFDDDAQIIHDYAWLESRLGPLVPMEVVVRVDNENFKYDPETRKGVFLARRLIMLDEVRKAIEAMPEVDVTMSAMTFIPEIPTSTGAINAMNSRLEESRPDLEAAGWIANSGDEELFRISLRLGAFSGIDYGSFVHNIQAAVTQAALESGIQDQLDRYAEVGMIERADGVDVTYTGVVPIVYKSQSELMIGLRESYMLAFAAIAGMMVILVWPMSGPLKAVPGGLLCMIPNVFPTAVVFGAMAWLNHAVDIGSMMTASIALGVAVDDTVHYLAWYKRGVDRGMNRRDAVQSAYGHCARAMTQTTLVAGFGISMHIFSTFTPTMMFGVLMVPLMGSALVGDLIMLPALLVSPLGWLTTRKAQAAEEVDEAAIVPAPAFAQRERQVRVDRRFGT